MGELQKVNVLFLCFILQKLELNSKLETLYRGGSFEVCRRFECDDVPPFRSEPNSSRLLRSGGFRIKPSMKTSMVLIQDSLEDHSSLAGGGNGRRGDRGSVLQRRAGSTGMQGSFSKQQRHFTAKIVAMGDDRILGRLAKEYYFFRCGRAEGNADRNTGNWEDKRLHAEVR